MLNQEFIGLIEPLVPKIIYVGVSPRGQ